MVKRHYPGFTKEAFALQVKAAQIEDARRDLLVSYGWEYTSKTPNCVWMFKKAAPTGEVIVCRAEDAIEYEERWEQDAGHYWCDDCDKYACGCPI